jgi:hypothetical protein
LEINVLNTDVRALDDANDREQLCRTIIAALPEWFGIEKYNVKYAKEAAIMDGMAASLSACLSIKRWMTGTSINRS